MEIGKIIISGIRWHDMLFIFVRALTLLTPSKISQLRIFLSKAVSLYKDGTKKLKKRNLKTY